MVVSWCKPTRKKSSLRHIVFLGVFNQLVYGSECQTGHGVCTAVVDGNSAGIGIGERRAGESNVGNVAVLLVRYFGAQDVELGAVFHLPRLVDVQDRCAHTVYVTVAGGDYAVVDQQPTFIGLDGAGACAGLGALPCGYVKGCGTEYVSVLAPEGEVGRLGYVDVTEGGVAGVTGTGEHHVLVADLAGEEHAVTVIGQECVFQLMEGLEIEGIRLLSILLM